MGCEVSPISLVGCIPRRNHGLCIHVVAQRRAISRRKLGVDDLLYTRIVLENGVDCTGEIGCFDGVRWSVAGALEAIGLLDSI